MRFSLSVGLVALASALVAGCDKPPAMPEVNDANCQFEEIKKIKDKDIQQAFSSLCLRRGEFKPSSEREW